MPRDPDPEITTPIWRAGKKWPLQTLALMCRWRLVLTRFPLIVLASCSLPAADLCGPLFVSSTHSSILDAAASVAGVWFSWTVLPSAALWLMRA